ncbi:aminodeoxychorismate synthase component I [Bacteroides oleiciplenus]|uniref:aminodeoxychorismate synthase component I n=1 Tax=Bacteroides oleiciplenus TaxID=626931 RepID=UPI0026DD46DF|nr:aminodeoxychorismate synthase component I [Bacteroides oleiciplenus]
MKLYNKQEAMERMNVLASCAKPFVFLIDYLQEQVYVEEAKNVSPTELVYNLNGFTNEDGWRQQQKDLPEQIEWNPDPVSFEKYSCAFEHVRKNILAGNSFLTNLTSKTPVHTNLTLEGIYCHSRALYKVWVKERFVVFSPEIFVRINNGIISSYPMKGTIDAALPDARHILLEDEKEAAEHATIVDLIRNDLSIVASHVRVSRYRYIDVLQTNRGPILQTSSEICGKLPEDYKLHLGDILFSMLPAGSITGAPKKKTMQIIREAEGYERGFYTGVTGYFDGTNLDSAVMIRFVEQQPEGLYFKSGGGITFKSDVRSEYEEMKQKVYVPIY